MKIGLVCGTKGAGHLLREWAEYYIELGIDKLILFDNNTPNRVFEDLKGLEDYLIVLDGKDGEQLSQYNYAYNKFGNDFDWLLFFDDDEWLFLNEDADLRSYLSRDCFKDTDCIHVNWKLYGDCGHVHPVEGLSTPEMFPDPLPLNMRVYYPFPENCHVKTILHCKGKNLRFPNPHFVIGNNISAVNNAGVPCNSKSPFSPYNYDLAELRHYQLRTTEEFCYKRLGERSRHMYDGPQFNPQKEIQRYFIYNQRTPEKEKFINEYLNGMHR